MIRLVSVLALLLAALSVACGGGSTEPEQTDTPAVTQIAVTPAQPEAPGQEPASGSRQVATPVQPQVAETTGQPETTTTSVPSATQPSQSEYDDDRVVGLVAEWENDLASIARVVECVERTLELERPLRPEDFELKANQPAIVACVKAEVGQ